jgi:hypothetical protein
MKIVYLDSAIINPGDISWENIEIIGKDMILVRGVENGCERNNKKGFCDVRNG